MTRRRFTLIAIMLAMGAISGPGLAQSVSTLSTPPPAARKAIESDLDNLAIARTLTRAGSLNLALEFLQTHPPRGASLETLEAWAEQKWSLLILLKDWNTLKQDAHGLPGSFGAPKYFALPYEARAMIELGELDEARRLLQPALLVRDIPITLRKAIREQMIDLYRAQGDYVNAKIEAIRFHDEFKPQDTAWFIKRAAIEYLAGDAKGAARLLAPIASVEARLLQTLFRLESGEIAPQQASTMIARQMARKEITEGQRKLAYALEASINRSPDEAVQIKRIKALENYLVIDEPDLHRDIITFSAQDLKTAYIQFADSLINSALLDSGRSGLKFKLAQQAQKAGLNVKARALYADVLLANDNPPLNIRAKNLFIKDLIRAKQLNLLTRLFGNEGIMGNFSDVDSTASAQVLNFALENGDAALISSIAPFLGAAPENVDSLDWILQKSRVDIFAGRFREAETKINQWLDRSGTLSGEQVDRVLQPVFDLQAIHQNEIALKLFDRISSQTNSSRHRREILFWKAQSYDDLGERITAAQYYLRSAMKEANGFDQWGLSARYHAAFTLMEAGQYYDARRLFEALLSVASDASRRATIKQSLQRLWLLENQLGG